MGEQMEGGGAVGRSSRARPQISDTSLTARPAVGGQLTLMAVAAIPPRWALGAWPPRSACRACLRDKESLVARSPGLTSELERARLILLGCYTKMASVSARLGATDPKLDQAENSQLESSNALGDIDASIAEQENENVQQLLAVSQQLGLLSDSLAAKDTKLERAEVALTGSNQQVSDLNARLAAAEHDMSSRIRMVEAKDVQIHELIVQVQLDLEARKQENASLYASLAAKDADQAVKDTDLVTIQTVLGQRNAQLEDIYASLACKACDMKAVHESLTAADSQLRGVRAKLEARDGELEELRATAADAIDSLSQQVESNKEHCCFVRATSRDLQGLVGGTAGKGGQELMKEVGTLSAVKVAIAVRPLLKHEEGCQDIVTVKSPSSITLPKKAVGANTDALEKFEFDRVLKIKDDACSKQVFSLVVPVVERFTQGFNATVLAYGQTGSGKTYTMGTSCTEKDFLAKEPRGVVLFSYVEAASQAYDIQLKLQYVEIYNNEILDLLVDPSKTATRLDIRERNRGEVYVDGAVEVVASSNKEVAALINKGNSRRSVAAHKMNSESSRSHAILTLTMEQRAKPDAAKLLPKELLVLRAKLHLVDLAGSERVKDTQATGNRFNEGVNINKGLLALGNVINALTEGKTRTHVPYRDSKLTRLLADSLGGNSETLFIACVSPADTNHEQTLNTLRYASRARAIKNRLRQNNELTEELEFLRGLVKTQEAEIAELKEQCGGLFGETTGQATVRRKSGVTKGADTNAVLVI
eukprot:gene9071-16197_t